MVHIMILAILVLYVFALKSLETHLKSRIKTPLSNTGNGRTPQGGARYWWAKKGAGTAL